jgi:hypothetical protein
VLEVCWGWGGVLVNAGPHSHGSTRPNLAVQGHTEYGVVTTVQLGVLVCLHWNPWCVVTTMQLGVLVCVPLCACLPALWFSQRDPPSKSVQRYKDTDKLWCVVTYSFRQGGGVLYLTV